VDPGLDRYRGPLLDAAWDLGDRIDNITARSFFETYGTKERRAIAVQSTLFRFSQYFGWAEIVRREVQLLRFESATDTRRTAYCLLLIVRRFATDWYDSRQAHEQAREWIPEFESVRLPPNFLMLWHEEQRGIGERMIVSNETPRCKGFATFVDQYEADFAGPLTGLEMALVLPGVAKSLRLLEVRDALARLVVQLDNEKRFEALESGYETWLDRARSSRCWKAYNELLATDLDKSE
jgi:hypothetical protein